LAFTGFTGPLVERGALTLLASLITCARGGRIKRRLGDSKWGLLTPAGSDLSIRFTVDDLLTYCYHNLSIPSSLPRHVTKP
jgi:hypothetical protein